MSAWDQRVKDAVQAGDTAFWGVIAEQFPEIKTGDFDPPSAAKLLDSLEEAVTTWLRMNSTELWCVLERGDDGPLPFGPFETEEDAEWAADAMRVTHGLECEVMQLEPILGRQPGEHRGRTMGPLLD